MGYTISKCRYLSFSIPPLYTTLSTILWRDWPHCTLFNAITGVPGQCQNAAKNKDDIASDAKRSAWIQCKYRLSIDRDFRYKYNKVFKTRLGWDIKPISWPLRMGLQYQKQSHDTLHDDVIRWNHFPRYWPFVRGIRRSPVNSPHKGQWSGALMFSLICAWITIKYTVVRLVIRDAIALMMTSS